MSETRAAHWPSGTDTQATGESAWVVKLAPLLRLAAVFGQFALLLLVLRAFHLESKAFRQLMALAFAGAAVHHFLPLRLRMPFFCALSVAGFALVLGPANAAWILALGGGLIGLAHLPIAFAARVGLIAAAGGLLSFMRVGGVPSPVPSELWPILGSMFMFRMAIYLYDLRHRAAPFGPWRALAYFFMFPNVCFPLFPVIDYKAFSRSHYDAETLAIYQKGLVWMFRGLVHLVLYRLIYQNLLLDASEVANATDAIQFIVTTFLLYLYVSGIFHVIVGVLHLFGFNLSETHHYYLLSSSITDLWRRINIYWKDFMMKLFFYPAYFQLKRLSPAARLVSSTLVVVVATWILHSYQWFWLRGDFPLRWQDFLFWMLLGSAMTANMVYEARTPSSRRRARAGTTRGALGRALRTIGTIFLLLTLWSLWTSETFDEWLLVMSKFGDPSLEAVLLLLGIGLALGLASFFRGDEATDPIDAAVRKASADTPFPFWKTALATTALAGVLLVLGNRPFLLDFEPRLADALHRVRFNRLNLRDTKLLERGYYEDLSDIGGFNSQLWALYIKRPPDWDDAVIAEEFEDFPRRTLFPDFETPFRGASLSTNQWSMRDREYTKEKPAGTTRIAMVGTSHAMGLGVNDEETFENLTEDQLNATGNRGGIEILNFSAGGYGPYDKLRVLETRVFAFDPDAVLWVEANDPDFLVRDIADAIQWDAQIHHDSVAEVMRRADIEPSMPKSVVQHRLKPYRMDLLAAVYGEVGALAAARGVPAYLVLIPKAYAEPERESELARLAVLAAEAGLTVIDLRSAYDSVDDPKELWIAEWDRHPNAAGHALIAEALDAGLRPHLPTR